MFDLFYIHNHLGKFMHVKRDGLDHYKMLPHLRIPPGDKFV